jgi:tRNA G10  N-methylase Trm11
MPDDTFIADLAKVLASSTPASPGDLEENLVDVPAAKPSDFSAEVFFRKWFRENGSAFFFLFRKNLKVTNIQFAELLSLLRSHTRSKSSDAPFHDLQFVSTAEFKDGINGIVDSFPIDKVNNRYELIAQLYASLVVRNVVIDSFFGSCVVFIPPHLKIDLLSICASSGYIHSCGNLIMARNIEKATKEYFYGALNRYLLPSISSEKPVLLTAYTHEDFSRYDQEREEYFRDGLDDVKLYIEKFYMGPLRVVEILKDLRKEYEGKLIVQEPGDPKKSLGFLRGITYLEDDPSSVNIDKSNEQVDSSRTVWLLMDYSIVPGTKYRGDERYYICYEQLYMNEHQFQLFEENKPAWRAPTTIPHTLIAAMLNIAELPREQIQGSKERAIADPFVGTGTLWLEAQKFPDVVLRCSDNAPIAALMAEDNLEFFSADIPQLMTYWKQFKMEELKDHLNKQATGPKTITKSYPDADAYKWALDFLFNLGPDKKRPDTYLSETVVAELRNKEFCERLYFYIGLRTVLLDIADIEERGEEWFTAYARQAERLANHTSKLIDMRVREDQWGRQVGNFSDFQGRYSRSCSISTNRLLELGQKLKATQGANDDWPNIRICDARANTCSLEPRSCDLIITDPPYGFNTDDDPDNLAELYSQVLETMINALKDEGQLVLCLLDRSFTGRRSPFFTHKELITQQILSIAERVVPKREVIIPAFAVPPQREIFRAPYYWESERALRRAILHFRVRTRPVSRTQ